MQYHKRLSWTNELDKFWKMDMMQINKINYLLNIIKEEYDYVANIIKFHTACLLVFK